MSRFDRLSRRRLMKTGAALFAAGRAGAAAAGTTIGGNTGWVPGMRKLTDLGQTVVFKIPKEIDITALNDQGGRDGRLVQCGNHDGLDGTGPEFAMYVDASGSVKLRFSGWYRTAIKVAAPAKLFFWPYAANAPQQIYPISARLGLGNTYPLGCQNDGPFAIDVSIETTNSGQYPLRGCFDVVDRCYLEWAGGGPAGDCN